MDVAAVEAPGGPRTIRADARRSLPDSPASPLAGLDPDAPPFLIIHGTLDTLVLHQDARAFADRLRTSSGQPVVYAELPGANHSFDFFHSIRFHAVIDAIIGFSELTLAADSGPNPTPPAPSG